MEKVLVAYASGLGSTGEVALAIGDQLTRAGFSVDVRPFKRAGAAENYCALVAGCAVRDGRWENTAVDYLVALPDQSPARTYLFQWYPDERPGVVDPRVGTWLTGRSEAGLVTFSGQLGPWSPARQREIWSVMPLTEGDLRWRAIHRWAHSVGAALGSRLALAG